MESWVESFSIAWMVPIVLDAVMMVAGAVYEYFVLSGFFYFFITLFFVLKVSLFAVKMYFPTTWVKFLGMEGGGEQLDGLKTETIMDNVWNPMVRMLLAIMVLIQIRPSFISYYIVNPFLQFGSIYASGITSLIAPAASETRPHIQLCSEDLSPYLTTSSCEFLMAPINDIARVNNKVIEQGLVLIARGASGAAILFAGGAIAYFAGPVGQWIAAGVTAALGAWLLFGWIFDLITGIVLVATFFAFSMMMSLIIIDGILKLGIALILYPFEVITFTTKNDKINPWEPLMKIVTALKNLVIAMIAVSFILIINVVVAGVLFQVNFIEGESFAARGMSLVSAIMAFFVMYNVVKLSKEKMKSYMKDGIDPEGLYGRVKDSANNFRRRMVTFGTGIWKVVRKK